MELKISIIGDMTAVVAQLITQVFVVTLVYTNLLHSQLYK
jgi:hypothetical protein